MQILLNRKYMPRNDQLSILIYVIQYGHPDPYNSVRKHRVKVPSISPLNKHNGSPSMRSPNTQQRPTIQFTYIRISSRMWWTHIEREREKKDDIQKMESVDGPSCHSCWNRRNNCCGRSPLHRKRKPLVYLFSFFHFPNI